MIWRWVTTWTEPVPSRLLWVTPQLEFGKVIPPVSEALLQALALLRSAGVALVFQNPLVMS